MELIHSTYEELFTAIANSIRIKKGTTDLIVADDFPSEIDALNFSSEGGIDTSDATATANDIAAGTSAYVNGIKIDGSIPIITNMQPSAANNQYLASVSGNPVQINFTYTNPSRMIVEAGATMALGAVLPNFGTVQPGDVVAGQTFTSTAGLKKAGTLDLSTNLTSQSNLINQIQTALNNKMAPASGNSETIIQLGSTRSYNDFPLSATVNTLFINERCIVYEPMNIDGTLKNINAIDTTYDGSNIFCYFIPRFVCVDSSAKNYHTITTYGLKVNNEWVFYSHVTLSYFSNQDMYTQWETVYKNGAYTTFRKDTPSSDVEIIEGLYQFDRDDVVESGVFPIFGCPDSSFSLTFGGDLVYMHPVNGYSIGLAPQIIILEKE